MYYSESNILSPDMGNALPEDLPSPEGLDTVGKRLRWARTRPEIDLSQKRLADLSGVSQGLISQLELDQNAQSKELPKIAKAVRVDVDWLAEGTGDYLGTTKRLFNWTDEEWEIFEKGREDPETWHKVMELAIRSSRSLPEIWEMAKSGEFDDKITPYVPKAKRPRHSRVLPIDLVDDPYLYAKKVRGLKLSAGPGHLSWEHEEVDRSHAFRKSWLDSKGISDVSDLKIMEVEGNSMWPKLEDGMVVAVHTRDRAVRSDKIYAIAVGGETRIKRLYKRTDGSIEIRSDNPDKVRYPTEILDLESANRLEIIGRMIWYSGED